ncbi:MAG TPA: bifunctional [glutamine synthetase] adenylyltransferase/[glutamine synthetase]-adenylyl-L-tyrosine phosphorylase, partial [Roseiarcus sp.]|nr:bifunctional [glutamine synthetase] adenylyltransferase/[glutamine synthetase]-adenylyl-L-tyrosine phosphorylase [Roseiarcus sp.]
MRDLALAIADHSPYLWRLVTQDPERLGRLLRRPPEDSLAAAIASIAARSDHDESALMSALRRAKHETALLVALADLGGAWNLSDVVDALTQFADCAVSSALRFLLRDQARAGRLALDAD